MRSTYLVAMRDYLGYVTAWGFWLGLLFTPVLIAIMIFAPALAEQSQPVRYFTVIEKGDAFSKVFRSELGQADIAAARELVDPASTLKGERSEKLDAFDAAIAAGASPAEALQAAGVSPVLLPRADYVEIAPPAADADGLRPFLSGEQLIETPDGLQALFAAIVVPEDGGEIEYWSENLQAQTLLSTARSADYKLAQERIFAAANVSPQLIEQSALARRKVVQQRLRSEGDTMGSAITMADKAPFVVSVAMAFLLWFLIFSVINYLLMGTIEERSNKIFDTLLTSVKLPNLLAGKLLAVLALALTLMIFWALGSTAIGFIAAQNLSPDVTRDIATVFAAAANPAMFIPAIISFVLGYLMYGSLFLALGSLCDTIQEAQTLMTPLIVLLMAPLFMLTFAMNDAQSAVISAMVWVPLFTPFLLILRMPTEPPLWEVLAQLGLMAGAALLILFLAARVYRAGAVHGAGVADALAWFASLVPGRKSVAPRLRKTPE